MKLLRFCTVGLLVLILGVPAQATQDSAQIGALYEQALQDYHAKEMESAAAGLKTALQQDPRFLAAHVLLAKIHLERRDPAQAEKSLLLALRMGADRSLVLLPLADAYEQQRDYERLLEQIQTGDFDPSLNASILVRRGDALLQLGRLDEAGFVYTEAARFAPDSPDPLLGMARVLIARGDLDGAQQQVALAIDRAPRNPEAWQAKGAIAHADVRLQAALRHYARALELAPDKPALRVARAGVFMDLGQDEAALRELQLIADQEALDPQVPYLMGVILARIGQPEASREAMLKANAILLDLPPELIREHSETLLLSSLVAYSLGEWEQARGQLEDYVARYPESPAGRKLLGSLLFKQGHNDRAIRVLEPVLKQLPDDTRLLTLLGKAYLQKGWNVVALEMLERAVRRNGAGRETRTLLALARLSAGREEAGLAGLREVFLQKDGAREAGITLVMTHLRRGEFEPAREIASVLSQRNPDSAELRNLVGGVEAGAGRLDAARGHFLAALDMDPALVPASINLSKIERAEGNLEQARARLARQAARTPNNILLLAEQARVEASGGDLQAAIGLMEKAVALNEKVLAHQLYLGELYLGTRAYDSLEQQVKKLARLFPDNPRIRGLEGRADLSRGRMLDARNAFRSMSKLADGNAIVLMEAGRLSWQAGDPDWAVWSLQNVLKLEPDWLAPRLLLAEIYLQSGRLRNAGDVVAFLNERYPDLPQGLRLRGDLAFANGNHGQAEQAYRAALKKGGGQEVALRLYRNFLASGEISKAVEFLRDHLTGQGGAAAGGDLSKALAEGYLHLGDRDSARALYEKMLDRGLADASVLNNLAMIYAHSGDPRALELAQKAHRKAPENPAVSDTLGWLLVESGQPAAGLHHLRSAHLRAASSRGIRYHIASALALLERRDEALHELEAILADGQEFADRSAAIALFDQLDHPN